MSWKSLLAHAIGQYGAPDQQTFRIASKFLMFISIKPAYEERTYRMVCIFRKWVMQEDVYINSAKIPLAKTQSHGLMRG